MIPTDPAARGSRPQLRTVAASEGPPEFDRRAPARVFDGPVARAVSSGDPATPVRSLQTDEQLVALVRCGHQGAFDTLAARYQRRLLSFCLQMLRSKEDAEDALQDVFASAYSAILADDREIQVRPWLYRIARNRCLNQLRRTAPVAVDSMDEHSAENGLTLVEKVVSRQELRELLGDVQALPDTQRAALLLREIDGFAYAHIAVALDTTVPGVKSLLRPGAARACSTRRRYGRPLWHQRAAARPSAPDSGAAPGSSAIPPRWPRRPSREAPRPERISGRVAGPLAWGPRRDPARSLGAGSRDGPALEAPEGVRPPFPFDGLNAGGAREPPLEVRAAAGLAVGHTGGHAVAPHSERSYRIPVVATRNCEEQRSIATPSWSHPRPFRPEHSHS